MNLVKNLKKVIAIVLCLITVFSVMSISASAASVSVGTAKTGTSATYTIKNSGSGKMLNVYGSKSASNTNVTIYQSDGTKGQKCKFISNGTTTYNKVSYNKYIIEFACAPSCALNVYGSAAANNSNVNIWKKSGNTTQAWILEYVTSPAKGYIIRSANNPKYVLTANGTSNSSNVCLKTYSSTNKKQVWTCSAFSYSTKNTTSSGSSTTTTTKTESNWMWPTTYRRISCGFADNVYHTSHWHRGIDIPVSSGTDVYASKSGTVALVVNDRITGTPSRGTYIVIDHGDGYYSEYQHLKSVSVKKGDTVKQGDAIAKSGKTDNTSDGGSDHLHFEIMYLGKSGLGASYTSYWSSYSKYVNTNPQNTDKVFCTKGNAKSQFKIGQKQNEGVPKANLVKTNKTATYGVYCYDTNGINYVFK